MLRNTFELLDRLLISKFDPATFFSPKIANSFILFPLDTRACFAHVFDRKCQNRKNVFSFLLSNFCIFLSNPLSFVSVKLDDVSSSSS